ncbi:MAG TPA: hypothetical protein DCM05_04685 [Elusimicrobia bacterium]|nr:hypothetical protein [Elusimicrobiota bacterium]
MTLSLRQARRLVLEAQGLCGPVLGKGRAGALAALERLGYVQIDTISVVERAHHHTLWARVPGYVPAMLDALLREGAAFEYWSHAAAVLPMRDYRFSLPRKLAFRKGRRHWHRRDSRARAWVLDRIRAEGALRSADFEPPRGRKPGPWFEWKPAKVALEQLFQEGLLMVAGRTGFQKLYDLTERVLPPGVDAREPDAREAARHLVLSGLRAHGPASEAELCYQRRGVRRAVRAALRELEEAGEVLRVRIEGRGEEDFILKAALETPPADPGGRVRILSPFDNLVIQRRRLERLFGFGYQIECYLPAEKRRYGYFCLPVLRGESLVGMLDAKADRGTRTLRLKSLHLDPAPFREEFEEELGRFARFNGCRSWE